MRTYSGDIAMAPPLLTRHPLDYALIPFFAISVLYGALFSLPEGLGLPVTPDSPWPPLRALHGWAVVQEPTHLDPPRTLIASTLFDGFVQTPLLIALIVGLLRRRAWARPLGLLYAGAAVINMWFYFFETLSGPLPPPHLSVYLSFNLPWLIAPAVLGWRLWPRRKPGSGTG
jgi:hypothetical protein